MVYIWEVKLPEKVLNSIEFKKILLVTNLSKERK